LQPNVGETLTGVSTYKRWREDPWPLPEVTLAGFSAATLGASLSTYDGRRVISLVVDKHDGTAVVLALTDEQAHALDTTLMPDASDSRSEFERFTAGFHAWLADLDLDDNEMIGKHTDAVFAGFVLGGEPPANAS